MPNIDHENLAMRSDLERTELLLRGEMAELRSGLSSEMVELRGDVRGEIARATRTLVFTQLGTSLAVAGFGAGLA